MFFSPKNNTNDDCFHYPEKIDQLNSRDVYDSARWILFNWLGPKKLEGIYYGQMELRYREVLFENDTTVIFFQFYAPDTSSVEKVNLELVAHARVAFRTNTKKSLGAFVYPFEDFSDGLRPGDKRLESPPSDTTIKFLNSHRSIINDCYLQLAKKKQVIDQLTTPNK